MGNEINSILDFLKRLHLSRQKNLLLLKTIQIRRRDLADEEKECRAKITNDEAKIRSEVERSPELKKKFGLADSAGNEVDDEDNEGWKNGGK